MKYLIIIVLLFSACNKRNIDKKLKPTELRRYGKLFPSSPFYDTIPANVEIDINSEKYVSRLVEEAESKGFFIALKRFTIPVYYVSDTTKKYDVVLLASWSPKRILYGVPIPDYAEPDPGSDGHLVIIDTINGCEYDLWQARKVYNKWYASWGNAIPLNTNGIFRYGYSARGSGFALTQGVIFPDELVKGEINHALVFSYSSPSIEGPVPPATESDGFSNNPADIPEGTLIRLNPNLNLDSLNLTPYEKVIARALQKYGMYCGDAGGGLQLYAVNPISTEVNPYKNILPDENYIYLNIPVSEFQVIKIPMKQKVELKIVDNGCAIFNK